ncbi:hypothetical protein BX283_6810 [Streptomyces sp. TLI_146]|nr:hypothetical protein BX283_6810 [Streptomyces sp. TLI_146]
MRRGWSGGRWSSTLWRTREGCPWRMREGLADEPRVGRLPRHGQGVRRDYPARSASTAIRAVVPMTASAGGRVAAVLAARVKTATA